MRAGGGRPRREEEEHVENSRRFGTIASVCGLVARRPPASSIPAMDSRSCRWRSSLAFLVLFAVGSVSAHSHHHPNHHHQHFGRQQQHHSHDYPRSPVEWMTDLTNRLGFRILYHHSVANRNNIALSPCGLASVLIALYEGSDGPSAIQIHKAMELPWDRDMVRIGFRDIHRRLRSYFYREDNLLSGLSLSEGNVTVRPEYENILRFYGYDLDNGNMITSKAKVCKNETEEMPKETTTMAPMEEREEMDTTTVEQTTMTEDEMTTVMETTTPAPTTTTTTTTPLPTTTLAETTTTEEVTETSTVAEARTTNYIYKFKPPKTTTEGSEAEALESTTPEVPTTTTAEPEVAGLRSTDDEDANALKRRRRRKNRTFNRWKRSPLHYFFAPLDEDDHHGEIFVNPGTPHPQFAISDYVLPQPSFSLRDSVNEAPQHEDVITHLFYLNRQDTINVPFKVFNSIMRYGYFSAIQSSVLEVDLDSNNYSLLIILPDWLDFGLEGLISTMKSPYSPHLREIRAALQPTWVKAIIPKFFLTGHIVLTADLQNMGVLDIFEPTRADFTPMTDIRGIYTRHVEQTVDVNIRTHANDHLNRRSAYHKNPVELSANHPFMFVIIDNEVDVAILTGRILNPLNARIQ